MFLHVLECIMSESQAKSFILVQLYTSNPLWYKPTCYVNFPDTRVLQIILYRYYDCLLIIEGKTSTANNDKLWLCMMILQT